MRKRCTGSQCVSRLLCSRHRLHAALLLVLCLVLIGCSPPAEEPAYSEAQQAIVEELGEPAAFQLAYLPSADEGEEGASTLLRTEVWYYPEHEQQISFIDGVAVSVQGWEWQPENPTDYPALSPARFTIDMTLENVAAVLGVASDQIDELPIDPGLTASDDLHVYATATAVFTIERGALTYLQTIGVEQ